MLHNEIVVVTPFAQNCSIVWCDQTMQGAVIDPGGDIPHILQEINRRSITVNQLLITHGHLDHCAAAPDLAAQLNVPIIGPHLADKFWIDALPQITADYGFPVAQAFTPARWLHDGDRLQVGQEILHVRHCPGHTPGHVVFHAPAIERAFVGDVLFAGSIGRTDFPQGDYEQLIGSITERLWPMGDNTVFVPGHGPQSSFGRERQANPFVKGT